MTIKGELHSDSSAALGICQRKGVGKVRHSRVQALWVQEVHCSGRLKYHKILGSRNPSDILTTHFPADLLDTHLKTLGTEMREGRAEVAPELSSVMPCDVTWVKDGGMNGQSDKKVRTDPVVRFKDIPAVGMQRCANSFRRTSRTRKAPQGENSQGEFESGHSSVDVVGSRGSGIRKERWADIDYSGNEVESSESPASAAENAKATGIAVEKGQGYKDGERN